MDFKKLFRKDDKAVSPVIGVILMVAITVILAAAIGSSVFSHGTAKSAPQANLDIKPVSAYNSTGTPASEDDPAVPAGVPTISIENRGGDEINFDAASTKVLASVVGGDSKEILINPVAGDASLGIGDVVKFTLSDISGSTLTTTMVTGKSVNLKFVDKNSGQIFCDRNIVF
ncbi:MAG TPA: type IV pilin [Methanobacterium sp.]|nr:type IV pilin [Methanobacterium sp.]